MRIDNVLDKAFMLLIIGGIALFILYPVICIALRSIQGSDGISFEIYAKVWKTYAAPLQHSIFVACFTSVITTFMAVASVFCLKTHRNLTKTVLMGILLISMVTPPFVSSLAYIQLYGRNGLITKGLLGLSWNPYNKWGIILMESISFTPLNALYLNGLMSRIDKNSILAARDLGAGSKSILTDIIIPLLRPGIIISLLLSFVRSLADFGTPIVIGGRYTTLASDIYLQVIGYSDLQKASAMNMMLLIPSVLFFALYRYLMNKTDSLLRIDEDNTSLKLKLTHCGPVGIISLVTGTVFYIVVVLQYICIFISGFLGSVKGKYFFTLSHWNRFIQYETTPLVRSIKYALIVAVCGTIFAILLSYYTERRKIKGRYVFDFIATLPYMIPGTCFGLGYLLAFSKPPIKITGTAAIVILNMLFKQLPTASKISNAALTQIPSNMENAAKDLGAGKIRVFTDIILPNMGEAFFNGFVYNFTAAMTTAGAILFLIRPAQKIAVFRLFDAAATGDYAIASLIASSIIVVCMIICSLLQLLRMLKKRRLNNVSRT